MTRKPFAAFGRILYANYYDAGEVVDVTTTSDSRTVLFLSDGHVTARDKNTGNIAWDCKPGWIGKNIFQEGLYACTANKASVCWCYDPLVNQNFVPTIEVFHVPKGGSAELPVGTHLFLCSGVAQIKGRQFTGPYQVSVANAGAVLTANTDVYGMRFA